MLNGSKTGNKKVSITKFFLGIKSGASSVAKQSPKNLVGALALPTGKFLHVRKVVAHKYKIGYK